MVVVVLYFDLQIEIGEDNTNLKTCIENYLNVESCDYSCHNCPSTNSTKKLSLYITPKVLVITLKRFKYSLETDSTRKLCTGIEFPENLDLSNIVTGPNNHQSRYRLYAVSNHIGSSFRYGHYTAHCLNLQNDKWLPPR